MSHIEKMARAINDVMIENESEVQICVNMDAAQAAFDVLMADVPDLVWGGPLIEFRQHHAKVSGRTYDLYGSYGLFNAYFGDRGATRVEFKSLSTAKAAANARNRAQVAANWPDGGAG